jgi:hypothetical protein
MVKENHSMTKYQMDYIEDKELYKAVMFARKMIRQGKKPAIANSRAAQYYRLPVSDVAKYTGQTGGRVAAAQKKRDAH